MRHESRGIKSLVRPRHNHREAFFCFSILNPFTSLCPPSASIHSDADDAMTRRHDDHGQGPGGDNDERMTPTPTPKPTTTMDNCSPRPRSHRAAVLGELDNHHHPQPRHPQQQWDPDLKGPATSPSPPLPLPPPHDLAEERNTVEAARPVGASVLPSVPTPVITETEPALIQALWATVATHNHLLFAHPPLPPPSILSSSSPSSTSAYPPPAVHETGYPLNSLHVAAPQDNNTSSTYCNDEMNTRKRSAAVVYDESPRA